MLEVVCVCLITTGFLLAVAWAQLLEKFRKLSRNANFAFPETRGTGFVHMLAHVSKEAVDLVTKLLIYDPDERWVAQAPRLLLWPACGCPVTGRSSSLGIECSFERHDGFLLGVNRTSAASACRAVSTGKCWAGG